MPTYLAALALVTGVVCMLWLMQTRPMALATAAFLVAFGAQSSSGLRNNLVSRLPILLLFVLAIVLLMGGRDLHRRGPSGLGSVQGIVGGLVMLFGATIVVSSDLALTIQATAAATTIFFVASVLGRSGPLEPLLDRLAVASGAICVMSVLAIGVSADAFLGNRLSGIFRNPNAMGSAVVITLVAMPRRWLYWSIPPLLTLLVATGSRASALGFLVALILRVEWRPSTKAGAILVAPVLFVMFLMLGQSAFTEEVDFVDPSDVIIDRTTDSQGVEDLAILRTRDNRSSQWTRGWSDALDHLPLGSGFGTADFEYSSSPLFLIVETGVLALPIALLLALLIARSVRHEDHRVRAMAGGLLVHSVFEGWMFAFGSFQALIFWMVLIAAATDRTSSRSANALTERPTDVAVST